MTPCEKLGYKVGDKFEMLVNAHGFKKGAVITLAEDDGSDSPYFHGKGGLCCEDGVCGSYAKLAGVKPLTTKLRPAKQALADAIHASGKGWPDGANWAAQDKDAPSCGGVRIISFYSDKPVKPASGGTMWNAKSPQSSVLTSVSCDKLLPNWHQTVLSRDEYFSAYPEKVEPVVEAALGYSDSVKAVMPVTDTTDQLLTTWQSAQTATREARVALEAAKQAEREAEEAVKGALGKYGWGESVVESVPLDITDWHELKVGDVIWWEGDEHYPEGEYRVNCIDEDTTTSMVIGIDVRHGSKSAWVDVDCETWKFIHRP